MHSEVHRSDGYPVNWPEDPAGWLSRGSELGAWIVEADGRVAGHVSLAPGGPDDVAPGVWSEHGAGRAPDRTAVLGRLFVAPRARGRGVGALLIGTINNGLIIMGLDVSEQNMVAGAIIILAVAFGRRPAG